MRAAWCIGLLLACKREEAVADDLASRPRDLPEAQSIEDRFAEPEFVPKRTIHIKPEDVLPIPQIEASLDPRKFEARDPGPPRELLRAKHLRLGHAEPLVPNAGIVEVLSDGTDDAKVLEAHLVDFDEGPIAALTGAEAGVYSKFGVARAEATIDGKVQEVLVHADGKMIAWREGVFADATLYVNPGLGDAWLFVNEGSDDALTSYSHWTDLRSPPPAPTRELPFHFEPSDDRYGDKIVGPRIAHADAIPTILERGDENADCARVLLHADGSFGCIPHLYHVMADGWRLDPRLDDGRLANVETGDLVVLQMGPDCVWPAEFTPDPPRAYYPFCFEGDGEEFIWAPHRTVRLPAELLSDQHPVWAENRHVRSFGLVPQTEEPVMEVVWLDMVAQQVVRSGHVYHLDPWRYDRFVPYTHEYNRRVLLLLSLAPGRTQLVHKGCVDYAWMGGSGPRFAYTCLGPRHKLRWTAVIDTERAIEFRLPPLRDLWLQQDPPVVLGIVATRAGDRLVAWPTT